MDYITIDSPEDIEVAVQLMVEYAKNPPPNQYFFWGGITMFLPSDKHINSFIELRNLKTREMESVPVIIDRAYCGCSVSYSHSEDYFSITCSALNEDEGYYTTKESGLGEGTFIGATRDLVVFKKALIRFFSTEDFNTQRLDPLSKSVIPVESWLV